MNKPMIIKVSKEWCQRSAEIEGDSSVGAGAIETTALFSLFEMLGRTIYAKVTGHVGCGEADEWCEEVMEEAEKIGLARREVFDPEIHGHEIDAEPGEDVIWTWGFLPEGWQTTKPPVEFLNVMGEPETDPGKCGFMVINDARALSRQNVTVQPPPETAPNA